MIIEKSKWFNMMHFQGMVRLTLGQVAGLAGIVVALSCLSALAFPSWAIVLFIAAAPAGVIFTGQILRLPFAHTLSRAKVVFVDLCIFATKLFAAPITSNYLTSPSQYNHSAFRTTSNSASPFSPVRFCIKLFSASWAASEHFLLFSVGTLAFPRAKENTALASFNIAIVFVLLFATIFTTGFSSHIPNDTTEGQMCQTLVACEQLGRRAVGVEIEPKNVALTLQRLCDMGLEPRVVED